LISPAASQNPNLLGTPLTPEQSNLLDRADQTITEMPSQNQALVAGGVNSAGQVLNSAKLVNSSPASVTTDKTDYAPGTIVTITGRGFQANEDVALTLHERPDAYADPGFVATADAQGNFIFMQFAPQTIDVGRTFTLTAIGQTSGFTAQTAFTDSPKVGSVTVGTQSPNPVTAGNNATYTITVNRGSGNGSTGAFSASLSVTTTLPTGATASFSPSTVSFTSTDTSKTSTLTISTTISTPGGTTSFSVQATKTDNAADNASGSGSLAVTAACTAPSITTNPTSQTVVYGNNATFTAAASGNPTPTVQWQVSTDGGTSWSNIGGATNTTLTITAPTVALSGNKYRAAFTNTCNGTQTATTSAATLTVNKRGTSTAVSSSVNPSSIGQSVTFTATVTGTGAGSGNPSSDGNVTFKSDGSAIGSCSSVAVNASGQATCTTSTLTVAGSPHAITAEYRGGANFADSDGTLAGGQTVNKASPTFSNLTASQTITYGTASISLSGKIAAGTSFPSGQTVKATINGVDSSPATIGSDGTFSITFDTHAIPASATPYTITYSYAGDANFTSVSDTSTNLTVNKATPTVSVTWASYSYDGTAHPATGFAYGVGGVGDVLSPDATFSYEGTGSTTYGPSAAAPADAGTYKVTASFAGNANYTSASNTANATISKATSTTIVTIADATYDGNPHGGTASVTGVGGLNQSLTVTYTGISGTSYGPSTTAPTNAGAYKAEASFSGDANHEGSSDSKNFNINKADSTITLSGLGTFTYDGSAHAASANVTGAGGLNQAVSVAYSGNCSAAPVNVAETPCTVTATFAGDANHNGSSATGSITITKAASATIVTVAGGESFTYDGNAHPATVSVAGVGGLNLTPAPVYSCGHAPIDVADSGCIASYTYAGDANHNGSADSKTYTISKASSTTLVTVTDATYDGNPHGGSAAVTGVGGLNQSLAVTYTGILGTTYGPSTMAPTNAGSYSASANFAGDGNHNPSSDTKNFTINKADSTTTLSDTGTFTYDGFAHAASAIVTGAGGLNQAVSVAYSGNCSAAPVNVAETPCTVTATFAGDANHNGSSATGSITITKAASTTTVAVSDATYDGNPHGGTASVTGVGGLNQSLAVIYTGISGTTYGPSTTAPINAGAYKAEANFSGDANHEGSSDSKNFNINKADSITTVTGGESFTYDGNPHPATVSVTGVGGLNLTPAPVYSCGHVPVDVTDSGCTASYTYAGDANHNGSSDSKTYTISKAGSTTTVSVSDATYDGLPHGGAATVTGIGGLSQSLTVTYAGIYGTVYGPSTTPPTNAGSYSASASFAGDANHNGSSDTKSFKINKANATINVVGYTGAYDGNAHGASGTATGVGGADLSASLNLGATFTNVPGGTAHWSFSGGTNYNDASGDVAIVINKANQTINVTQSAPAAAIYNTTFNLAATGGGSGNPVVISTAGVCSGGGNDLATITMMSGTGTCTVYFNQAGNSNYYAATQVTQTTTAQKATATVTLSGLGTYVYDGTQKVVTATTNPTGLTVNITYAASPPTSTPPTNVGTYTVVGTISDTNYQGSATGILVISPWTAKGFYQPVDMPTTSSIVWNTVKGGSTVPLKFEIFAGSTELTNASAVALLQAQGVGCTNGVESTIAADDLTATGGTSLRYDTTAGQFIFNWQTAKAANSCYKVTMTAQDGSHLAAYFKTK
jgi:hypothetical protein